MDADIFHGNFYFTNRGSGEVRVKKRYSIGIFTNQGKKS